MPISRQEIVLPQTPKWQDYRHEPPCLAYAFQSYKHKVRGFPKLIWVMFQWPQYLKSTFKISKEKSMELRIRCSESQCTLNLLSQSTLGDACHEDKLRQVCSICWRYHPHVRSCFEFPLWAILSPQLWVFTLFLPLMFINKFSVYPYVMWDHWSIHF